MISSLILILVFLLLFIFINNVLLNSNIKKISLENFSSNLLPNSLSDTIEQSNKSNKDPVLYPIKGLQAICAKEGLKPSFMPKACYVDDSLNSYANCKCEDIKGNCKICYPEIKKDSSNSNIVYNADVLPK